MLSLGGCRKGPATVKVHGKIVQDGQPYQWNTAGLPPGDPGINIGFIPNDGAEAGEIVYAKVAPDGSFEVPGFKGNGIPPGKYRITVRVGAAGRADDLKDRFNAKNSTLSRDITGTGEVIIDIGKSAG
jgi:hypothetical protein